MCRTLDEFLVKKATCKGIVPANSYFTNFRSNLSVTLGRSWVIRIVENLKHATVTSRKIKRLPSWWLNHPFEKYAQGKLDQFPKVRGENKTYLKPPPNNIYSKNTSPTYMICFHCFHSFLHFISSLTGWWLNQPI